MTLALNLSDRWFYWVIGLTAVPSDWAALAAFTILGLVALSVLSVDAGVRSWAQAANKAASAKVGTRVHDFFMFDPFLITHTQAVCALGDCGRSAKVSGLCFVWFCKIIFILQCIILFSCLIFIKFMIL